MKKIPILIVILLISFALASCGANSVADNTPIPTSGLMVFVAEGHVVPQNNLTLAFMVRGKVAEILVSKGEKVKSGQVLIKRIWQVLNLNNWLPNKHWIICFAPLNLHMHKPGRLISTLNKPGLWQKEHGRSWTLTRSKMRSQMPRRMLMP